MLPNPSPLGWRSLFGAWYVEDTIKLRPNLTLRAGLRDEFTTGWNEADGRAANYVTDSNGVLVTNPVVGNSVYTQNNATNFFGPRVGLAWDVFGNGKTAVRAGFGTYYSLIDDLAFLLNSLPPYNGSATFAGSLFNITPITPGVQPPASCTGGPNVPVAGCSIFAPQGVQPNAKTPTVQEWNFTVEQHLSSNTVLRVAYVGSFGYHGLLSIDPNTIPAAICLALAVAGGRNHCRRGPCDRQSHVPQGAQYIPVGTRPNPSVGAGFFWYTEGNSSYNALQIDVVRRLTNGLQFRVNYTWSKNLDMNSGLTGAQSNNQAQMIMDRNDLSRDWGPSAFNVAHQVSISAHYELPFGKGTPRRCRKPHRRRMASERHRHAIERLPLHAAIRFQPLGRRRYPQPGSSFRQPCIHRTRRHWQSESVVQSRTPSSRPRPAPGATWAVAFTTAPAWRTWICRSSKTPPSPRESACSSAPKRLIYSTTPTTERPMPLSLPAPPPIP